MEHSLFKKEIPIRRISSRRVITNLRSNIKRYEQRYEISSNKMLNMISSGQIRETAEILKWLQDYHVLQLLNTTIQSKKAIDIQTEK